MAAVVSQLQQLKVGRGHAGGRSTHFGPQIFEQTQKEPKLRRDTIKIWTAKKI
jgi:hypothetical protein